jgi:hypothetical protein
MVALYLLIALILYILLAWLVVYLVKKYTGSTIAKYFTVAVFILIPSWDILPGRLYFQRLCKKEAGIKVFKTVEVEKTYFKSDGAPDEERLSHRFKSQMEVDRKFSSIFHIAKIESSIQDYESGELLATATDLRYHGGWLFATFLPQGESTVCPSYPVHAQKWKEAMKQKSDIP